MVTVEDEQRPDRPTVLFLCTGNYYRSRTAEALFNHFASATGLAWRAVSRGLRLNAANPGPISQYAVEWLEPRGIPFDGERYPTDVTEGELAEAQRVVAVDESEHRPMMAARFPAWEDRVQYWLVHDIDQTMPADALPALEAKVRALVAELQEASAG